MLERLGRNIEAMLEAQEAAELAPANGETQRLAARLLLGNGMPDVAWEHAVRALQASLELDTEIDELSAALPYPGDLDERLSAPRVAVIAGPSVDNNLLARAALPRAVPAVQRAIVGHEDLALVGTTDLADIVVAVSERDVDEEAPRKFEGRLSVYNQSAEQLYDDSFTLEDLDNPTSNTTDLTATSTS